MFLFLVDAISTFAFAAGVIRRNYDLGRSGCSRPDYRSETLRKTMNPLLQKVKEEEEVKIKIKCGFC